MSNNVLFAKIIDEGYCCMKAYLEICEARNETPKSMAKNIGISIDAIWFHQRKLRAGKHQCQGQGDCMKNIIAEITKGP